MSESCSRALAIFTDAHVGIMRPRRRGLVSGEALCTSALPTHVCFSIEHGCSIAAV